MTKRFSQGAVGKLSMSSFLFLLSWTVSVCGWTYQDTDSWATEYPQFCGQKPFQSPINIEVSTTTPRPELSAPLLNYQWLPPGDVNLTLNELELKLEVESEATGGYMLPWIETAGPTLEVRKVNFHYPSEHQINGTLFDVEIQMLHWDEDSKEYHQLAILAKKKKVDPAYSSSATKKENPFFKLLGLTELTPEDSGTMQFNESINFGWAMPLSTQFFYYQGSLTQPPCTPANWYIFKEPLELSEEEINQIKALLPKYNTRPIQELGDRPVYSTVGFVAEVEKGEKYYTAVVFLQFIGLTIATLVLGGLIAFAVGEVYQRGAHKCQKCHLCRRRKASLD